MVLSTATAAADAYDPLRTTVGSGNDNILEYVVEDGAVEINSYLAIMPPAVTSADQTRAGKWQWCTGLNDPVCDPKNSPQSMKATSILPPCATAASENCIDSVEIGNATTMVKATLIFNYFAVGRTWDAFFIWWNNLFCNASNSVLLHEWKICPR